MESKCLFRNFLSNFETMMFVSVPLMWNYVGMKWNVLQFNFICVYKGDQVTGDNDRNSESSKYLWPPTIRTNDENNLKENKCKTKYSILVYIPRNEHLYFGIWRMSTKFASHCSQRLCAHLTTNNESIQFLFFPYFKQKVIIKPFNCSGIRVYRTLLIYGHH